jgi:protein KRI1
VPTYKEITSSKSKGKRRADNELLSEASEDENGDEEISKPTEDSDIDEDDFEEIVDRFESSYNFRFEEP